MLEVRAIVTADQVVELQAAIFKLGWGDTVRMNGWRIWRNSSGCGKQELSIWVESPRGSYSMHHGIDYAKVEGILEMMSEDVASV